MSQIPIGLKLLVIGLIAMVLGVILPFLMLIDLIPSTFFLNFLAFTISVGGLFTGIIGIGMYVNFKRDR